MNNPSKAPQKKYSKDTIKALVATLKASRSCIHPLHEALKNEGCPDNENPAHEEDILYLDEYEQKHPTNGGTPAKTVDFVVGLTGNTLLLVEAKLNADTGKSVTLEDLKKKVNHSKEILHPSTICCNIDGFTVVLCPNNKVTYNRIYRVLQPDRRKEITPAAFVPMKVNEFYNEYFTLPDTTK